MSNFKNNSKYPIKPSSGEPFVPYFLRSSRATEPIGGRDYVIFPDSFPNIGMPLTGEEMLMVQGKLPEPEILTPNQIKEYFSGSVVQDSQGFVTGDQVYKELLKYVPITRKVNGYALDKDIWLNKDDVGLGNVDNTSDLNKPISTATQEALDNLESKHDSEIARLDAKDVDLQNQINDLETSGGEIRQELINHMKDPNAHPEIVDQTMSDTSTKAISNKIVKAYIDTIISRQGSKNSVVANDEILVMGADGKYYRATIQRAVLDLVDSVNGDMGKVLHFVGEAGNSAGIPDINSQKDGALFYVSKLATPTTTITDAVTGQNFTSCDVVMKDGSQWKIIGKTMWWVNLAYSYSEPNKKATITNTAGTGFEIPLASDTVTGLYPKEHFYDVSRASATPAAGIIPKYTSESKLKSGASATSNGEVLIYEQIQQILDLARIGVNYSILDMSNPIKAIYNSGSTGTGRPITPFWDYSVGLTNCCGGDNNSIILKQNSEMVGTTNSVVGTVILTGSLVDRIKLTNKLYCSMDFDTLVNEQASLKITIKNGKSGTILGEVSLLTVDLAGMYSGYVELDTTSLDSSTNNFLTIEMVFTPTSKMSDVELPDGEGEAVVTKPADWSTNKVDKVCISVDPIDDTSLDVITQSELSRIQPILTHIANANVHVTKQDKDTWDAKATEDFVLQKIQDLIGDAPDVLDTLEELAEALKNNPDIIDNILNDLTDIRTKYLPLTGGLDHTLTGITYVAANWILSQGIYHVIQTNDALNMFGSDGKDTTIVTKSGVDIQHLKGTTSYKIWDASNVSKPLNYVNGTAGSVISVYTRNLNLNGTNYPFIGTGTTVVTLFAPTTAGTSGQVLQSQGAGKAPVWVDGGTGGGVQLSDDNVWTGLNTFQGGLKTSDGTNSYDVWDNNSLKYPVKYEINSIGNYKFNYYTKTAGWRMIDQVAINNILPDTITSLTNGGYGTLGLGTNAYESAAIADILTNSIYFEGLKARVLSTNSDGDLEYGSTTNYGDFNSRNIRIAYPLSSGGGASGGGSSTTYEGGLTIGYYPVNTKGTVTERAKIYCTTSNLYLKDLAKNTQLDFDTDGLYITTGSTSKVRLATLNDISGSGGDSVSLSDNNIWTGTNTFKSTVQVQSKDLTDAEGTQTCGYDIQMTDLARTVNFKLEGHLDRNSVFKVNDYNFIPIAPYATLTVGSGLFTFNESGSLTTKISGTNYEFWNKNNLAKPITYNTNTEGGAVLYKGDSASKIDRLVLLGTMPDDSTPNILQGGTGGFGSAEHAYASCHIGAVYTNEIHTYIDNDMTATVNLTIDDNGVYFAKSDGTLYKLMMEVVS